MATLEERIKKRQAELRGATAQPASGRSLQERVAARAAVLQAERNQDGTYGRPPEGSFTNEAGQVVDPAMVDAADKRTLDAYGRGTALASEYIQGTPFVGEYLDEAADVLRPGMGQRMRDVSDAYERQNPGAATTAGVVGGVVSSLPFAAMRGGQMAANFIGRGRGLLDKGARIASVGGGGGAVEGSLAASGRAEPGSRAEAAAVGGVVGGGLGAVLGPLAAALGVGVGVLVKRFKKLDVDTIASELGIDKSTARIVRANLADDDLDGALARLTRQGDDAILADAGLGTRQALDTAMSFGGQALQTGRRVVGDRARQTGERFRTSLDDILGAPGGLKGETRKIAQRTSAQRAQAYQRAYAQPTPMVGDSADALSAALQRVPPRTLSQAVDEANDMMRDAGMRNMNIMASIDEATGEVTFSQPLSVAQLDYIARGLGEIADAGTDKLTGAMSGAATRANSQARALRDAMKDGVPGYAQALKIGGDNIAEKNALLMGRKLLSGNTSFEDVITTMRGASDEAKQASRQGLRQNIDAIMSRARTTLAGIEDGSVDFANGGADATAEAIAAVKALSSGDNMRKMRVVLGADARRLGFELERVGDALALRAAVARNSATAIRRAGQEQMAAEVAPSLARRTAGEAGSPFDALREVTRSAAGTDAATLTRMTQDEAAKVADVLTRIQGPEAARALEAVKRSMQGQPMRDADAAMVARVIGGGALAAGYQLTPTQIGPR